ncbi:hypothetical protein MBRA_03691 [Methylobacterium brachiatum]|nr:hypothetical protein MBRA_03691 [Methylobacterium brachiatum]
MASRSFPHPSAAPEMDARWLILADDLTGAADCAVAFRRRGNAAAVIWGEAVQDERIPILSYDADSRGLTAEAAAQRHAALLGRLHSADRRLFKKIDSTMRGQPAAEIAATLAQLRARSGQAFGVLAPAFPGTGRTTLEGRVRVGGRPLEEAEVWRRDHSYASADLGAILASAGIRSTTLTLPIVRGGRLAGALAEAAAGPAEIAVCDAETDDDLARIAEAGLAATASAVFIGSAGLAHALAAAGPVAALAPVRIAPDRRGSSSSSAPRRGLARGRPAPRRRRRGASAGRARDAARSGGGPAGPGDALAERLAAGQTSWSRSCWAANPT